MSEHPPHNQPLPDMPPDPFVKDRHTTAPMRRRRRKITSGEPVRRALEPFPVTLLRNFDEDEPGMRQYTVPIRLLIKGEILIEPGDLTPDGDMSPDIEDPIPIENFTPIGLILIQRFLEIPGVIMILVHLYDIYLIISPSFEWKYVQADLITIISKLADQPMERITVVDLTLEEDDKPNAGEKAKKIPPK